MSVKPESLPHSVVYWKMRPTWIEYLDLAEQLPDTLATFLFRYKSEDGTRFAERVKRLAQINMIDLIVDQYCSLLFSTEIMIDSAPKYKAVVDSFIDECNMEGDTLQEYARETVMPSALLYGVCDVFVDLPRVEEDVVTAADEMTAGLTKPYCYMVPPLNRLHWELDDRRNYTSYWSQDVINTQVTPSLNLDDKQQWHRWTPQEVIIYDENGREKDRRTNPFGFIPAVTVMPIRSKRFFRDRMGVSLIKDVTGFQKLILNTMSLIQDFMENVNFAHRVLTTDENVEPPTEAELAPMDNNQVMMMRGSKSKFEIVMPDPAGVKAMAEHLDTLIELSFRSVWLPCDANVNKTHQSHQTIRTNYSQLYQRLSRLAKYGEKMLKQIIEMALRVQGIDPQEAKVSVSWDTNFDFEASINSIMEFTQLRTALKTASGGSMSPTAEREWAKKMLAPQLYNSGSMDEITKELQEYADTLEAQSDEQPQQDAQQQDQNAPSLQQQNTQASVADKIANEAGT